MSTAAPGAGPIRSGDGELEQLAGSPESRLVLRRLGFGGALAYRGCLWPNNKRVRTKQTLPTNCHTKGGTHTSFIVLYMYTIGRQSEFPPRDQSVSKCDIPPSLPRHTQHTTKAITVQVIFENLQSSFFFFSYRKETGNAAIL